MPIYSEFFRLRLLKPQLLDYISKGKDMVASTASEYPLANFCLFRSLARNYKITSWDIPNPYAESGGGHG